jgi:NTP pyrophosphatase (non-canonical NTP hydrolase)
MTRVKLTSVRTFPHVAPNKAQALKVLEEAAEVVEAWKDYRDCVPLGFKRGLLEMTIDEIADTIQACCNLAAAHGVTDLTPYLARCEERNRKRGRYE